MLPSVLDLDVGSQHLGKLCDSSCHEDILRSSDSGVVVGSSSRNHGRVVGIVRQESLGKLVEVDAAILVFVVTANKQLRLVKGDVYA